MFIKGLATYLIGGKGKACGDLDKVALNPLFLQKLSILLQQAASIDDRLAACDTPGAIILILAKITLQGKHECETGSLNAIQGNKSTYRYNKISLG